MFQSRPKGGKSRCPTSKTVRRGEYPHVQGRVSIFILFRPSADSLRPTHIREGNLLYLVYRFKC